MTLSNSGYGATITVANGSHAINAPVVLADNLTVSGSGTLAFGAASSITDNGLGYGLTMSGAGGTLILGGSNTYGGGTTIAAGTLTIGGGGQLGGGSYAGAISNAAVFVYNSTAAQTLSGVISGGGTLTQAGPGTLTLAGANTYTGPTSISAGTLTIGGAGQLNSGSYAANISNSGAFVYNSTAAQTLSGVISGPGALIQNGPSVLVLSGPNTFTGNITIGGGTLEDTTSENIVSPTVSGLGNPQTAGRTLTINSGGALVFATGNALGNGSTTPLLALVINAGRVGWSSPTIGSNNVLGNVTLNGGTLSTSQGFSAQYESYELGGTVTVGGTSPSTINGNGNNYDGLNLGINAASGYQVTFNVGLTGPGGAVSSNPDLTVSVPLVNAGASQAATGLIKSGAGMMLLSGTNTYTGLTTISAGTLQLGNGASSRRQRRGRHHLGRRGLDLQLQRQLWGQRQHRAHGQCHHRQSQQ